MNFKNVVRVMARLILAVVCLLVPLAGHAQGIVDCIQQKKLHVSTIRGRVVDPSGVAIPKASVWIGQEGKLVEELKTDDAGRFSFKTRSGSYTLRAQLDGFETTVAEVDVARDISNLLHPTALKVILALPGVNCPWVTSSNREYKELIENNATQK